VAREDDELELQVSQILRALRWKMYKAGLCTKEEALLRSGVSS
jgi:hypothetical protein